VAKDSLHAPLGLDLAVEADDANVRDGLLDGGLGRKPVEHQVATLGLIRDGNPCWHGSERGEDTTHSPIRETAGARACPFFSIFWSVSEHANVYTNLFSMMQSAYINALSRR
jgi:hypothetical protein